MSNQKKCAECGKKVDVSNQSEIGFICETFVVCVECNKQISEDWEDFQVMMKPEIEYLKAHSEICKFIGCGHLKTNDVQLLRTKKEIKEESKEVKKEVKEETKEDKKESKGKPKKK